MAAFSITRMLLSLNSLVLLLNKSIKFVNRNQRSIQNLNTVPKTWKYSYQFLFNHLNNQRPTQVD